MDVSTSPPSPASASMARKRNSPSADPEPVNGRDLPSPSSSTGSHTSIPSLAISSSPETSTTSSSPMVRRSSSSRSLCSAFQQAFDSLDSDSDDFKPIPERPKIKRRKTSSSSSGGSVSSRRGYVTEKKGNGKHGDDVWSPELEAAYHRALQLLPPLGRLKILVAGKFRGRNELISWYLRRVTGKERGRKQISSHLQVLKDDAKRVLAKKAIAPADDETPEDVYRREEDDARRQHALDFLELVSTPDDETEEFAPGAALEFFGASHLSPPGDVSLDLLEGHLSVEDESYPDGLLSPYTSTFLRRLPSVESACSDSPIDSPSHPTAYPFDDSYHAVPMTPTSSLTTAMKDLHFPSPPPGASVAISCPIAPVAFSLWAQDAVGETTHVFANLAGSEGAAPTGTVSLADLPLADVRFPGLVEMNDYLPSQFLHVKVNLDVPTFDAGTSTTQLYSQVTLTALQDLPLVAVTSIYSEGTSVLCLAEQLAPATRINGTSSPPSADSPSHPNPLRHKYSYQAPFASDFWSIFLRGAFGPEQPVVGEAHLPSFGKTSAERADFALAISGLSVVQEFVCRSEDPEMYDISPGSKLGDVVLVVTYDFECGTSSPAGAVKVSFLSTTGSAPSDLAASLPSSPPLPPPLPAAIVDASLPRPRHSRHGTKPSLSLHIPPPSAFLSLDSSAPGPSTANTGPTTPLPQLLHTPTAPPPVNAAPSSPAQRDRLEQIWARTSNAWEQSSPALMGAFPSRDERSSLSEDRDGDSLPRSHEAAVSQYPRTSQAMRDFTTSAIAAGTPLLATFPPVVQSHRALFGTPFVVHPAHGFDKEDEVEVSAFTGGKDSVAMDVCQRGEQDYFSGRVVAVVKSVDL